jgi:ATP-dependent Clp protease ATP-binding subunit ClpB
LHDKIISNKITIENTKNKIDRLQAEGKYEQASKLLYVEIPILEKEVKKLEELNKSQNGNLFSDAVGANEIASVISRVTGIPLTKLVEEEKNKLLNLKKELQERVKGQNHAVKTVADAVLRSRAGINDPFRPIGSFLFLGSTGVGKTELAKTLAESLFDSDKALVRFDMSEYCEPHTVSKLIGAAPGYAGFNENGGSGILTNAIKNHPFAVLLFDEIEKAHPVVLNILLQVLDEGKLTDSQGSVINFKNTIIILTSNIGAQEILQGHPSEALQTLKTFLRPEFINRIDEIVTFNPIDEKTIGLIIARLLADLKIRLENENILVNFNNEELINKIVKEAYDPVFGARPIKRYIQSKIENILATNIINANIKKDKQYELVIDQAGMFEFKETSLSQ